MIWDYIRSGLELAMTWQSILMITLGLLSGIVIGAIPGMTADIGIILCLPLTYAMDPIPAMMLLLGIYCGGTYGGSITAILINTPGTPANAATTLDGYPMTRQGKSLKALQMALYASFFGGIVSALICLFASPAIAKVAQTFGPPEYFCITLFGLSIIASISGDNIIKGIMGAIVGILLALVGQDSVSGVIRFSFGIRKLTGGIPLLSVLVGLFALAELLSRSDYDPQHDPARQQKVKISQERLTWGEIRRCIKTWVVSSIIGTVVGATPGTGGGIAAFISYDQAKKTSKYGDNFGKGEIEGVAAAESANNATTGSTLIPLMTLGIPGDGCTAILIGAFMLQGMVPGPSLFRDHAETLYGIMVGLLVVNVLMLVFGLALTPIYSNIAHIPYELMSALIVIYCIAGTYSNENSTFHVLLAVCIGIGSFLLRKLGFSVVPIILGVVLGELVETNFRNSMILSGGSWAIFVKRPFSLLFLALAVLSVSSFFFRAAKKRLKARAVNDNDKV
ncbi:tripartite tricarboxylate transporter permease [Oscillibacter valericigenes]|nr:tripartite tricarboxylate transporter permease [Oscillibacter valericigenes]